MRNRGLSPIYKRIYRLYCEAKLRLKRGLTPFIRWRRSKIFY